MSSRNLIDSYGTPISISAINHENEDLDDIFDISDEISSSVEEKDNDKNFRKKSLPSPRIKRNINSRITMGEVRFGHHSTNNIEVIKPKIIRIWHADNLFKEILDKDLGTITSFKSIKIDTSTKASDICKIVASKLVIEDNSKFKLYSIKQQSKKPIDNNTNIYPLTLENEIKIAFLVSNGENEETEITTIVGINAYSGENETSWEPLGRFITAHRRLLNHEKYSQFSNLTIIIQNSRIHSFRSIVECRFPQFYKSDIIKKKREKKNHIFLTIKDDCKIDIETMFKLLEYIYTGDIDFKSNSIKQLLKLLVGAQILKLKRLIWLCEHYLYTTLGLHNVFEMLSLSDKYKLKTVKSFCISFAHSNWGEFSASKRGLDILGLDLFQECTISVSKRETIDLSYLQDKVPLSTLEKDLRDLYTKMPLTDGIAELDDNETLVFHKAIVAAHDPALYTYLSKDLQIYKFPVDKQTFACLLRYIYYGGTSGITYHEAASIIESLLPKYSLVQLREICEKTLVSGLTLETALRILKLTYLPWNTKQEKLIKLKLDCLEFISNNFAEIDIPSIRFMKDDIAFDLLELMYKQPLKVSLKKVPINRKGVEIKFG